MADMNSANTQLLLYKEKYTASDRNLHAVRDALKRKPVNQKPPLRTFAHSLRMRPLWPHRPTAQRQRHSCAPSCGITTT